MAEERTDGVTESWANVVDQAYREAEQMCIDCEAETMHHQVVVDLLGAIWNRLDKLTS